MPDKVSEILLNLNAVILRTKPPFRWASGILSPIYTDNRLLMSYPKEREFIVNSFIKLIKANKIKVDGFAGTATAGIPWAAWIAQKIKKPMIFVRSESKDHGKENKTEGVIESGKTYVVVEDLISTGGSSLNTINAVREKGGIVEHCIAIFTYELEKSKINFDSVNVKLNTLTNFTNLIKTAVQKKFIGRDQLAHIMDWKKNPEGWVEL
ncbi:MAG TPA: orotate phosphoribosyltransferase [Candidatus Nanoarchaeia archaeon]|nr:orotate phosphoribosyltransferase [Candidatus Nanoarchaeia archaeon]